MKKLIIILLIIMTLYPVMEIYPQAKNVYWIHGLSGDASSLEPHDTYFKNIYQMNSSRPAVPTTNGIQGAANSLLQNNRIIPDLKNQNIMIAHSMGGVNSLWVHKLKGSTYVGGLVSMGSPYKGAPIAENILNGTLDKLITEGAKRGSQGIRSEPAYVVSWLNDLTIHQTIAALFNDPNRSLLDIMTNITKMILLNLMENQAGLTSQTSQSLSPLSNDIKAIQQYTAFTIPTISFYGVEDYPATLRFISSRLTRAKGYPVNVVGIVDLLASSCAIASSTHAGTAMASLLAGSFWVYSMHNRLANEWAVSRDYFKEGINEALAVAIGAYTSRQITETVTEWVPDVICENGIPYRNPGKGQVDPVCLQGHWDSYTTTHTVYTNTPSDGLIPITSVQAMPGCLKTVKIDHTNHEELKYSDETQKYLNNVFSGNTFSDRNKDFFKLTRR